MTADGSEISLTKRVLWVTNTLFHSFLAIANFFIFWVIVKNNKVGPSLWHYVWSSLACVPTAIPTMTIESSEISISQRLLWVTNTLFHSLLAVVTFFIFWVVFRKIQISPVLWHIVWASIAYIPLMAEGILLFADSNTWTQYIRRTNKYYLHGILLLPSVILVSVGCGIIINEKNKYNSKHFKSDHAITGLVSWVLCLLSVLLGLFAFYSQKLKSLIPPVYLKFAHNFFGVSAYVIGMASLILGLEKRSFSAHVAEEELNWMQWLLIIITIYSVLEACRSMFNQVKSMFS